MYKKLFFVFLPSIPLYFWGMNILSNPVQILGFLSYYYFICTLLMSPLSYLSLKRQTLKRYGIQMLTLRRSIWIITGIYALWHMLKFHERVWNMYEKIFSENQTVSEFITANILWQMGSVFWLNTIAYWFGISWIMLMSLLLVTSNNYSQKLLWWKKWKRLQKCVYPLFLILLIHIYFVWWWKGMYLYPALFLVVLRTFVFFDKKFKFIF